MKFVDLFCGIGGFHSALSELGHECVFACDSDKDAAEVYQRNFGIPAQMDIRDCNNLPEGIYADFKAVYLSSAMIII